MDEQANQSRVRVWVHGGQWDTLTQALDQGLDANMLIGDIPLFEYVCQGLEMRRAPGQMDVAPGPSSLLEAFIGAGLQSRELDEDGTTAVGIASLCGQWRYARTLVERGFLAESNQPYAVQTLSLLLLGRFRRMVSEPLPKAELAQALGENIHTLIPQERGVRLRKVPTDTSEEKLRVIDIVQFLSQHGARVDLPEVPDLSEWDGDDESDMLDDFLLPPPDEEPIADEADPHPGEAPIFQAIRALDEVGVEALLASGVDLTATMLDAIPGGRPLEFAIYRDSAKIVRLLLQAGAPTGKDPHLSVELGRGQQPLVLAAHLGRDRLIPWLLEATERDDLQEASMLAMHLAAAFDRVDCMKTLHLLGVPLDSKSQEEGYTLLHRAAESGAGGAMEYLLEAGLDWQTPSDNGVSAAEVLLRHHPELARIYGVDKLAPINNVRVLGRPKGRA